MQQSSLNVKNVNVKLEPINTEPEALSMDFSKQLDGLIRFSAEEMNSYFSGWECPELVRSPLSDSTTLSPLLRTPPALPCLNAAKLDGSLDNGNDNFKARYSKGPDRRLSRTASASSTSSQELCFPDFLGLPVSIYEGIEGDAGVSDFKKAALRKFGLKNTVRLVKSEKNTTGEPQTQETINPSLLLANEIPMSLQETEYRHFPDEPENSQARMSCQPIIELQNHNIFARTLPSILVGTSSLAAADSRGSSRIREESEVEVEVPSVTLDNGFSLSGWAPEQDGIEEPGNGLRVDIDFSNWTPPVNPRVFVSHDRLVEESSIDLVDNDNSDAEGRGENGTGRRRSSRVHDAKGKRRSGPKSIEKSGTSRHLRSSQAQTGIRTTRRKSQQVNGNDGSGNVQTDVSSLSLTSNSSSTDSPDIPSITISPPSEPKNLMSIGEKYLGVSGAKPTEPKILSSNSNTDEPVGDYGDRLPSISDLGLRNLAVPEAWSIGDKPYNILPRIYSDHTSTLTQEIFNSYLPGNVTPLTTTETTSNYIGHPPLGKTTSYDNYTYENERKRKYTVDLNSDSGGFEHDPSKLCESNAHVTKKAKVQKVKIKTEKRSPLPRFISKQYILPDSRSLSLPPLVWVEPSTSGKM